jgi:hypothetical protein
MLGLLTITLDTGFLVAVLVVLAIAVCVVWLVKALR